MVGINKKELVICCFCGNTLYENKAALLLIYPEEDREEAQSLYAHKKCLVSKLDKNLVLHPSLEYDLD